MSKAQLKEAKGVTEDFGAVDVHRLLPKAMGGTYGPSNYIVLDPVEHMREHGIYRERDSALSEIKAIIDDREQVRKLYFKVNNQLLAYRRRVDDLNEMTSAWLGAQLEDFGEQLKARDKLLVNVMKKAAKDIPLAKAALGVKGVGPVTVAYCLAYIDLEKARHASSVWAYAGFDKPSHDRYTKGQAGGGNKRLRTALYTMATSQIKSNGAYRYIYDNVKERLAISEKMTKTRNTQGVLVEKPWKDTKPSHRHGAALRAVMKHFLADYWYVGRELAGLPTNPGYAEAMLGKDGHKTINPQARGWVW